MQNTALADAPDGQKQSMPQANLQALKEFIELRRAQQESGKYAYIKLPWECRRLPVEVQVELREFLMSIPRTRFFQPDGNPRSLWFTKSAESWAAAYNTAGDGFNSYLKGKEKGMDEAVRKGGREKEATAAANLAWEITTRVAEEIAGCTQFDSIVPTEVRMVAGYAKIVAQMICVSDLDVLTGDYVEYLKNVWQVWQKGYALYGSQFGGPFYVYWSPNPLSGKL